VTVRRAIRFPDVVENHRMRIYETFTLHFERAAKEVARLDGNPSLASVYVSRSTWDRWMVGDIKGLPRQATCRVLAHLFGEPPERLFGPREPEDEQRADVGGTAAGARMSVNDGAMPPHLAAMESFRLADRQLGGGHVYRSVVQYLNTAVAPSLFSTADRREDGEITFGAAVVLTEMAAWMAHDAGRDDLASGHFDRALRLAKSLTDATAGANVLAGMSHLALQTNEVHAAADLARCGLARLAAGPRVPALAARLHAMEARALAQLNAPDEAQRSLETAREALALAHTTPAPPWVAPFDEAALASEAASVLLDLGVLRDAAQEAERALALRDASRVRSRAFGQVTLARVLLAQAQPDAACSVAMELLNACQSVTSLRLSSQLEALQDDFTRFSQVAEVGELLSHMTATAQHRRLLLGSLALPEGPQ
jgi:tetratricopeptide (TPR) repeat protein